MHQTTVRFSSELWSDLAAEADILGVSVAQFIREAALARLAYSAGRRGDSGWQTALRLAGAEVEPPGSAAARRRGASDLAETGAALAAQSRQARSRASELERQLRDQIPPGP